MAIPLPKSREEDFQEVFRLLLVSASGPQNSGAMMARVERLYHQTGGRQVGIIFLLQEHTSTANGTISYMELQARYFGSSSLSTGAQSRTNPPQSSTHVRDANYPITLASFGLDILSASDPLRLPTTACQHPKGNPVLNASSKPYHYSLAILYS